MGRTIKTAYIETEVDVDLDDFDTDDIVEYLEEKGYTIMKGINHSAYDNFKDMDDRIWKLYQTWKLPCNENDFWREMHSFFSDYYNKTSA
jgi:uncharacterized protein (DUF2164 family)